MLKKWFCNHNYILLGEIIENCVTVPIRRKYNVAYCPKCDKEIRKPTAEMELFLLKQEKRQQYEGSFKNEKISSAL